MVLGTIASILIVDGHIFKGVGRRGLLVGGGIVMCISEVCSETSLQTFLFSPITHYNASIVGSQIS